MFKSINYNKLLLSSSIEGKISIEYKCATNKSNKHMPNIFTGTYFMNMLCYTAKYLFIVQ